MMIEFDAENHKYFIGGREVPCVSDILRASNLGHSAREGDYEIPEDVMENARERGEFVHTAIRLWEADNLDIASLDGEIAEYLGKYQAWKDACAWELLDVERPRYSEEYDFAGTPDSVGVLNGERVVVDIKTGGGLKPWHGLQLAAYCLLAGAKSRVVLDLSGKNAAAKTLPKKELEYEQRIFIAARALWDWRAINGLPNR